MKVESVDIKVKELLEQFESLPNIQSSRNWNDALNRKLLSSPRKRKVRPALAIALVLLVIINAVFLLKTLLPGNTAALQNSQKLEVIAANILINPVSANN